MLKRGDMVYAKADPRHIGMVLSIFHRVDGTATVRIKWEETGWRSSLPMSELRKVKP